MGRGSVHTPDFINHPTKGAVIRDERTFAELTQRNDIQLNSVSLGSTIVGENVKFRVPNRGIASELRLHFDLAVVVSSYSTGLTAREKWPHGLIKKVRVTANGTDVVNCTGNDLHALRQATTEMADFSDVESSTVTNSNGTYDVDFMLAIPLAVDQRSLMGAIFAESDDTYLEVDIQFESQSQLFNVQGTTVLAWSGSIKPTLTTFDVPKVNTSQGAASVVPDLSIIHMLNSKDVFLSANGEQRAAVSRLQGQLMRLFTQVYDDSAYAAIAPNTVTSYGFRYGQNQQLRKQSGRDMLFTNARWYRDVLSRGYVCHDLVADNSVRDTIVPADVIDLEAVVDLGSLAIAAPDYIHVFEQGVVQSPTWANAQPIAAA
jgi:hypothetical protein